MNAAAELCSGLKVLDLGVGMAPALLTRLLVDAGADVRRLEPPQGDPFYRLYPAYEVWHRGKNTLRGTSASAEQLNELLAWADLCVTGGEDFPGLAWRHDAAEISARHRSLVVLDLGSYPAGTSDARRPAVDLLVQARSGIAAEHYVDRPLAWAFPAPTYGAALQGLIGALAALYWRQESSRGQVVSTSLLQGALIWMAPHWLAASRPDDAFDVRIPKSTQQLIFACADGVYIHVCLGTAGALAKLNEILDITDDKVRKDDRGLPSGKGSARSFFGDFDLFQSRAIARRSPQLLQALWDAGMAAERVLAPGACWDDPQVEHNGVIVTERDGMRRVGMPLEAHWTPVTAETEAPGFTAKGKGGPLAGVRVIDLGSFTAGPFASEILTDLGADVISIESPAGDPNRALFCAFAPSNRGKRALAVDMKSPEGAQIVRRLCAGADIVHHNFRPGVSQRLGIDAAALQAINPDLVVLETSGYGVHGPKSDRAGFDMIFQAFCGHEHRGAGEGNPPLWYRSAIVDFGAGMFGAVAMLMSLLKRKQGAAAPAVYVSLLNTAIFLLSELVRRPDGSFAGAPSINASQTGFHPAEQLYQTQDGWVAIAARSEDMARRLCKALSLGDRVRRNRREWSDPESQAIADALRQRSTADIVQTLSDADVWAEEVRPDSAQSQLASEELWRVGIVVRTADPTYGDLRQIGPALQFSSSPLSLDGGHVPERGEHTREILAELGYEEARIADLYRTGVIA